MHIHTYTHTHTHTHIYIYKGNVHPITGHEDPEEVKFYFYFFFNLGARWGGCATPRPGLFTSGNVPVPIL